MDSYANLILSVSKIADSYITELRFHHPDDIVEQTTVKGSAKFDLTAFKALGLDPNTYGVQLQEAIFSGPANTSMREYYKQCLAVVQHNQLKLRLRVLIENSASNLHGLRWETLCSLEDDSPLAMNQDHLFSRFIFAPGFSRMKLRPKKTLRALLVIANPTDLKEGMEIQGGRKLEEVDVKGELERAEQSLDGIQAIEKLVSEPENPGEVTLEKLTDKLEQGCDFLYLVAHGAMLADDPENINSEIRSHIWLENEDGSARRILGQELVAQIKHLSPEKKPRLVVLASCQSSDKGQIAEADRAAADDGDFAALGPMLVQAGVPAVLAMQGNVKMQTVAEFMPVFFKELLKDGWVDRAMMEARWKIRQRVDWWMPVLFLLLKGGRLWYEPGYSDTAQVDWDKVLKTIKFQGCVPVLGNEFSEILTGSRHEFVRSWAQAESYSLSPNYIEDLPQVAQYFSLSDGDLLMRKSLLEYLKGSILKEHSEVLGPGSENKDLRELISEVCKQRREKLKFDPYQILASLPFLIYINTNPDSLLEEALRAQNPQKVPQVVYFCWNKHLYTPENIRAYQELKEPTAENPIIFHLFGHIDEPKSLVVSEDDYFEYLMKFNKNELAALQIPTRIENALNHESLLFLGFYLFDWNFRVLFRSIFNEQRKTIARDWRSVAVQLQPGDDVLQPDKARDYLQIYFPSDKFDIYWGSAADYLEALWEAWQAEEG